MTIRTFVLDGVGALIFSVPKVQTILRMTLCFLITNVYKLVSSLLRMFFSYHNNLYVNLLRLHIADAMIIISIFVEFEEKEN